MNWLLWLGVVLVIAAVVYFVIVLWPQRIPEWRSVDGIISRIENEEDSE